MQRKLAAAAIGSLLAISMLALDAPGASAVIVQLENGKTVSYQPLKPAAGLSALNVAPLSAGDLIYHGGPVMTSNTNYTFYWSPSGSSAYPAGYQEGVDQYLTDLAHDSGGSQNVDSVATQYTNGGGEAVAYDSHFAGAILDTDPYPKNGCKKATICLTDAQLQAELSSWITAHGLPKDLAHEYFLLTPPGVENCFDAAGTECSAASSNPTYCAYHGSFGSGGGKIVYSSDAYVTGVEGCDDGEHPNESPSDGALEGGLSHEHNESTTDPELNAWFAASGDENGDKCRTFVASSEFGTPLGKAPDGSRYNQLVNGREYWYQQEWSNEGSTCKQRLAVGAPSVSKLKPKTGPAAGGTSVTITGSGFTGASAVHFGAAPASFTVNSSTSITALAPPGTAGSADVTVTGPGGTSAAVSADVFKYKSPTVTALSPNTGSKAGGTSVTISGSGFALGAGTEFKFGKVLATGVSCSSSSSCTATAPAAAKAGAVDVIAAVGKAKSKKTPPADRFTYG
ncbi:MAG TPA: IPT/TIG domain-containing protein [Polyangia bacterium]|nr:IPT/TIG domain-containing protein [Polyangia bacterium]